MKYVPSSLSLSIMIAALLGGTALVSPQTVSAATDLSAQTGWAITRVASMSQGSYCTMAQKFSNGTVLTIAKNQGGEYSLAFDFQAPKFQVGKALTASVKAGVGSTQAFEVQPSSPQAIVIGLGADQKFMSELQSSGKMQLDIAGESYAFNTVKFKEAQDELGTCMSSMKPQTREAKNDAKVPVASEAQMAEAAEAQKKAATAVAAPVPSEKELAAAPKSAAKALSAEDLTSAPIEPLPAATKVASNTVAAAPVAPVVVATAVADAPSSSSNDALVSENKRLKQSLEDARRSYENQMTSQQGARVPELQEKMRVLDMENAKLKDQLAKAAPDTKGKEDLTRLATELDKVKQDLAKATEENKTLQTQVASGSKTAQTAQLSQRELETLKAENQTLKNQLQIASKVDAKAATVPVPAADTAKLKSENETLKAEIAKLSAAKAAVPAPVIDPAQAQEIAYLRAENEKLVKDMAAKPASGKANTAGAPELQKRVGELQAENAALKNQLANADQLTPMPSAAAAPLSDNDKENLRGQIRDLRAQLEIVESESAGLRKQLETVQKEADGSQIKAAGGSWDLEQATRRYQESQREIRRLGSLLEEDRSKCTQEKKDIEYMLFDPEVAKPAQISMLNSLEDQVAVKDARIAALEKDLRAAGIQPASGNAQEDIQTIAPVKAVASEQLLAADIKPMTEKKVTASTPASAPVSAPLPALAAVDLPVPVAAPAPVQQPVPPVSVPAPVPMAAPAPQPVAVASSGQFQSSQDFASILKSAGVTIRGAVQPVQKVSSENYKAYSWQTDSLYGSAEQRSIGAEGGFEPAVKQYIDRAKSRCTGDFAAVPAQINGNIPAEGYEIACVSGQTGSSASVLFTYKDGIMTTVAHEGRAEAMDIAMDARDRVASKIVAN